MTLFNEINARKIHGQRNVFEGLHRNPIYYGIWIATFVVQVVLIQVAVIGKFFQTAPLTADQWLWCVCIGAGELVWHQLVTTVPSKKLPKRLVAGAGEPPDMTSLFDTAKGDGTDGAGRPIQILWIRGLTRLQTQVIGGELSDRLIAVPQSKQPTDQAIRVVNAFRSGLERREPSLAGPSAARLREISRQLQLQHSQRSAAASPTSPTEPSGKKEKTASAAAAFGAKTTASTSV